MLLVTAKLIGPIGGLITGNKLLSLILFSNTADNCQSLLGNLGRGTALLPRGNHRSLLSHSCFFSSQLPHSSHLPSLKSSDPESSAAFDFSKAVTRLIHPYSSQCCQPLCIRPLSILQHPYPSFNRTYPQSCNLQPSLSRIPDCHRRLVTE